MTSRRFAVFSVLLFAFTGAGVSAQEASIDARIDAVFERYSQPDSPGAVVGVVKDGKLIFAKGYGMRDIAAGKPLTPESRMNIGSTSKQFAAACIVLLAQDGKLSLDDDIRKWLPEMPDYGTPITIRHMLHHTSGLRDYLQIRSLAGLTDETPMTNRTALDVAARQMELNFKPGAEFLYSNTGYVLLAIIIQRASGKTMTEFAKERIFDPLGMTMTCVDTDLSLYTDSRALSYPSRGKSIAPGNRMDIVEGDGNVMTTVGDLAKWDQNFYDPKVGGSAFLETMLTQGVLNDGSQIDYALGIRHGTILGRPIVEHGGAWLGFRAQFTRFPQEHVSIIVLGNLSTINPDARVEEIAKIFFGESESSAVDTKPVAETVELKKRDLKAKTGRYFVSDTGTLIDVLLEGDALQISVDGQGIGLAAIDAKRFRPVADASFTELEFDADGDKQPASLTVESLRRSQVAQRVNEDAPAPSPEQLAGTYYSPEIDAEYVIAVNGGVAEITRPNAKPAPLEPIYGDWFRASFRYRFEHDATGKITGFRLSAGRVKNIAFERRN